uniref:BHLH domain-containing protein n=1 Tax=Romanomermis culicivorax TaxID=13658 RepID=A0A915KVI4_ROMCU
MSLDVFYDVTALLTYNINDRIKDLATLLPKSWTQQMKLNKGSILRATVEYLKFTNQERRRFARWRRRQRARFDDDEKIAAADDDDDDCDRSINDDYDFNLNDDHQEDGEDFDGQNFQNIDQILRIPVSITKSIDQNRAITITNYHYPKKNDAN